MSSELPCPKPSNTQPAPPPRRPQEPRQRRAPGTPDPPPPPEKKEKPPANPYGPTPAGRKHVCDNSHPEAVALIRRMEGEGAKRHKGYTPLPVDQHRWQGRAKEPPKHRIWSWMINHCLAWGHRCEYAVDKNGKELHIEHLAADLDMDLANAYKYWNQGTEEGLWRNGEERTEGERRLYLRGEIPTEEGEQNANSIVCTYNLPPFILKQTKDWPQERVQELEKSWISLTDLDRELYAALMAARRSVIDREQDNLLARFAVKSNRQEHLKKTETPEEAAARRSRVDPLLPGIELYVHTIRNSVQSGNGTPYNGQNGSVPTPLSLLPVVHINGSEERAGGSTIPMQSRPRDRAGRKHVCDNSHPEAVALIRRMEGEGAKRHKGYTPLPVDQHRWQGRAKEPPKHRIWSWMINHCLAWGHRCEYAVDKNGKELHIEHLAADLDMDLANAYKYWNQGTEEGLWRNGEERTEGERRLYLRGEIPTEEGEQNANSIVCTYNLPPFILKQTKDWPQERVQELEKSWISLTDLDRELYAALMAARRSVIDREQDNLLARFAVKSNRQEHLKKTETPEEAAARRSRVDPLLPGIELYVHTIRKSVQSGNGTPYNGQNGDVPYTCILIACNPH